MKIRIFALVLLSINFFASMTFACENYVGTYEQSWTPEQPLVLKQSDCTKITVVTKNWEGQINNADIIPGQTAISFKTVGGQTYNISYRWEGEHFQMVRDILDVDGKLYEHFTSTYNLDESRNLRFDLVYVDYDSSGKPFTYSSSATLKRLRL